MFRFRKIYFLWFTSGSGFLSFDFAGLVSVEIKNALHYIGFRFGSGLQNQKSKGSFSVWVQEFDTFNST